MGKLRFMRESADYEVVAAAEREAAQRRRRANHELFRGVPWVSEDEILSDSSINAIVFEGEVADAVPTALRALDAGKHVHLEKPPTNKMEPFRRVVESARRKNLLLQLGYIWRFHEGTVRAREAMKNGWLGDVFMIRATMNSDRDAFQRGIEARYKAGAMFELGGHIIDRVVDFLGRPNKVTSWLRHDTSVDDKLADNTLAVFEYDNALALIMSAAKMAGSGPHRSFEVIGTDGNIMIQPMEPQPTMTVTMREARGPYKRGRQEISLPPQPRYIKDLEEFADAVKNKRPLKYSYDFELLLHETMLRASGEL